jgi:hypothetical protein
MALMVVVRLSASRDDHTFGFDAALRGDVTIVVVESAAMMVVVMRIGTIGGVVDYARGGGVAMMVADEEAHQLTYYHLELIPTYLPI